MSPFGGQSNESLAAGNHVDHPARGLPCAGEAGIATIKHDLNSGNNDTRRAAWDALGKTLAQRKQSIDDGASPAVRATREANGRGGGAAPTKRAGVRSEEN